MRVVLGLVVLALAGCPHRNVVTDAGPPCTYTETGGNCYDTAISLDDTRVEALAGSALPAIPGACAPPVLVRITNVRDGDTVDVMGVSDTTFSGGVRLIGVNSPEIEHPPEPRECFGPEALAFSLQLQGRLAWLTFDEGCFDTFDRHLAYLWVGGGEGDLWQRQLLRRGFATTLTIPPNDGMAPTFADDQAQALAEMRGLHAACP
jgi:micrococcal nuclease